MFKRVIWLCLALLCGQVAHAQMEAKGIVVRVADKMIFIDLGRRDGVQPGDLFDILTSEVLAHPLTGDTLAVTPKSVGALRVFQVEEKISLAELLHIEGNQDPMLMKVARIQDPERLMEIEKYMERRVHMGSGGSRNLALVPGLYQLRTGERRKGLALMGLETVSLVAGIGYHFSSNEWEDKYDNLGPNLPKKDYDFYFEGARDRRNWSNRFFWLAGALYAYNWIDVMWTDSSPMMSLSARSGVPLALGLGLNRSGQALLQMTHRF